MSLRRTLRSRRGFTLAEVMTTATLIASLGGGGAFGGITSKGHQEVCLQHLKTIGLALQLRDLRGKPLPDAVFFPQDSTAEKSLVKLMEADALPQAFICPAAPLALKKKGISYIFNSKYAGKPVTEVPEPSKTWLVTDINLVDPKIPPAHNGGANVLFADCQARWVPQADLPKLR
jgi:prepilin-type processing-associated H-X9-DG protein/prepilin-type N-terminal cleavage/methylation domain-containing protein